VSRKNPETLFFLATVLILTALGGCALNLLNSLYVRSQGYAVMVLRRPASAWFLVAFPIGLLIALMLHVREIGPVRRARKPAPAWVKHGISWLIVLCSVLALAWARGYVQVTGSAIVEQQAFAWSRTVRPYSDISELTLARYWIYPSRGSRGYPSQDRAVFVVFRDGTRWSLRNIGLESDSSLNLQIAQHLAAQTRLLIGYPDEVVGAPTKFRSPVPALVVSTLLLVAILTIGRILGKRAKRPRHKRSAAQS